MKRQTMPRRLVQQGGRKALLLDYADVTQAIDDIQLIFDTALTACLVMAVDDEAGDRRRCLDSLHRLYLAMGGTEEQLAEYVEVCQNMIDDARDASA